MKRLVASLLTILMLVSSIPALAAHDTIPKRWEAPPVVQEWMHKYAEAGPIFVTVMPLTPAQGAKPSAIVAFYRTAEDRDTDKPGTLAAIAIFELEQGPGDNMLLGLLTKFTVMGTPGWTWDRKPSREPVIPEEGRF